MKRAVAALLLCVLVLPTGCGPSPSAPSAATGGLPAAFEPQKATLDFGDVTMLLYSFKSSLDDRDIQGQQRILQAVNDAVAKQTKARMTLKALTVMDPVKELQALVSAGAPPEISVWLPKAYGDATAADRLTGTTVSPLALDAALAQYGEHLRESIGETDWQNCMVNGQIVMIPQPVPSTTVPVLNRKALEKYNWTVPKTAEEFEQLLAKAKDQGLMPVLSAPYLQVSPAWYGLVTASTLEENGKLVPAMGSRQRLQWLRQQQLWITNKWMSADPDNDGGSKYVTAGNWLCREVPLYVVRGTPDITLLPPLGVGDGTPGYLPLGTYGGAFESYARPEAMVFLLDWLFADAANMQLISKGQENVDYKVNADGAIQSLGALPWVGSNHFATDAVPSKESANLSTAYTQVLEYSRQSGGTYQSRDGIPSMAWDYRLRGSRLDTAGRKREEYEQKAAESELLVLQGHRKLEDHEALLRQLAPLMEDYIVLVEDIRSGQYDVWQDVAEVK